MALEIPPFPTRGVAFDLLRELWDIPIGRFLNPTTCEGLEGVRHTAFRMAVRRLVSRGWHVEGVPLRDFTDRQRAGILPSPPAASVQKTTLMFRLDPLQRRGVWQFLRSAYAAKTQVDHARNLGIRVARKKD